MESDINKQNITLDYITKVLYKRNEYLKSCKTWEVKWIEEELNIQLPDVYRGFLMVMGKGAGDFMLGSSCFYKDLINMQFWAKELLEENEFKNLPDNSFVFWMHQGYQFAFFLLNEGNDPPIYYYTEVNRNNLSPDFNLINNSFTMFLYNQLALLPPAYLKM